MIVALLLALAMQAYMGFYPWLPHQTLPRTEQGSVPYYGPRDQLWRITNEIAAGNSSLPEQWINAQRNAVAYLDIVQGYQTLHLLVSPTVAILNVDHLKPRHVAMLRDMQALAHAATRAMVGSSYRSCAMDMGFHPAEWTSQDHLHLHVLHPYKAAVADQVCAQHHPASSEFVTVEAAIANLGDSSAMQDFWQPPLPAGSVVLVYGNKSGRTEVYPGNFTQGLLESLHGKRVRLEVAGKTIYRGNLEYSITLRSEFELGWETILRTDEIKIVDGKGQILVRRAKTDAVDFKPGRSHGMSELDAEGNFEPISAEVENREYLRDTYFAWDAISG